MRRANLVSAAGSRLTRLASRPCPTLSHLSAAGGPAKVCANWAFVSGVSPVSPYLELIDDYRNGERERQRRALVRALPSAPRQVGHVQSLPMFVGETTGLGHR